MHPFKNGNTELSKKEKRIPRSSFFKRSLSSLDRRVGAFRPGGPWVASSQVEGHVTIKTWPTSGGLAGVSVFSGWTVCFIWGFRGKPGRTQHPHNWQCQRAFGGVHWVLSLAYEDCFLEALEGCSDLNLSLSISCSFPRKASFPSVTQVVPYPCPPCGPGCLGHGLSSVTAVSVRYPGLRPLL